MNASKTDWVIDVTPDRFHEEVVQRSRKLPVVVDFWAPWCQPCRMLGPILERLAAERNGAFLLAKVNIDQAPDLAATYAIEAIPAVKAFRDGEPVLGFVGLLAEDQLKEFIDRILPTDADRWVMDAAAREPNDPGGAEGLYRRALEKNSKHSGALVGLARILIADGKETEAADLLERAVPTGDLTAETERLQAVIALRRLAREFSDEAGVRRRLEAEPGNARLRYELGCLLAAAGQYPEALEHLLAAAEADRKLATGPVREAMVHAFQAVGVRSQLADTYRDRLSRVLY
jgi:putative thioredoxin